MVDKWGDGTDAVGAGEATIDGIWNPANLFRLAFAVSRWTNRMHAFDKGMHPCLHVVVSSLTAAFPGNLHGRAARLHGLIAHLVVPHLY